MAKIQYGVGVNQIRGSINGTTFSKGQFGQSIGRKNLGRKNASAAQSLVRSQFQNLRNVWRSLSAAELSTWQQQRLNINVIDRFGVPYHPSAFNLFLMFGRNVIKLGLPVQRLCGDLTSPINTPDAPVLSSFQWLGGMLLNTANYSGINFANNSANFYVGQTVSASNNTRVQGMKFYKSIGTLAEIEQMQPKLVTRDFIIRAAETGFITSLVKGSVITNISGFDVLVALVSPTMPPPLLSEYITLADTFSLDINIADCTAHIINPDLSINAYLTANKLIVSDLSPFIIGAAASLVFNNVKAGGMFTPAPNIPFIVYPQENGNYLEQNSLLTHINVGGGTLENPVLLGFHAGGYYVAPGSYVRFALSTSTVKVVNTLVTTPTYFQISVISNGFNKKINPPTWKRIKAIFKGENTTIINNMATDLLVFYGNTAPSYAAIDADVVIPAFNRLTLDTAVNAFSLAVLAAAMDIDFEIVEEAQGYINPNVNNIKMFESVNQFRQPNKDFWTGSGTQNRNEAHMTKADAKKALD